MRTKILAGWTACLFALLSPALSQPRSPWPQIREFGGASPRNENIWVGVDDYPVRALRNDVQGNVVVTFDITADGRARNCSVETSSGAAILDAVPCRLIVRRARFEPASAEDGSAHDTKARYSVAFWLPS